MPALPAPAYCSRQTPAHARAGILAYSPGFVLYFRFGRTGANHDQGTVQLIAGILAVGIFVIVVFYLITLQRALQRCSLQSRTISPGKVWLLLIPLFNLVWQFLVVNHVARSLRNEFLARGIPGTDLEPGKGIGLAMCILGVASIIPVVGVFTGLAGFVCWIVYWVKIAVYSRKLVAQPT